MAEVKTYSAKHVIAAAGRHAITGFADDSFITIEKNGDGIMKKVGCDGEIARAVSPDKTYKVKIVLLQTSASNKFFEYQNAMDIETGDGLFPLMIKDLKGNMLFSADAAWVVKAASRTYGKDSTNREWEIETGEATLKDD